MHLRLSTIFLSVIAALLVMGAAATGNQPTAHLAKKPRPERTPVEKSRDLWATINVCNTQAHPNTVGIRGSMPGLGNRRATLQMRFQVQYKDKTDGKWHNTDESADSGWKTVGRTRAEVIESGQNFTFGAPAAGGSLVLRGSVRFKWLRKGRVVLRSRRFSEGGHRSTAGADPPDYSSALCLITPPSG